MKKVVAILMILVAILSAFAIFSPLTVKTQVVGPSGWISLSKSSPRVYQPAWSTDGIEIVFIGSADQSLWKMNADGSNKSRILSISELEGLDVSPDGTKIAFCHNFRIAIVNYDGTGLHYITPSEEWHWPSWSPDGNKIVAQKGSHRPQIFVINSDGTNPTQLTFPEQSGSWGNYKPSWSPDGTKIVYQGRDVPQEPKNYDVWVMDSDGQNQRRLTSDGRSHMPSWTPDGSKIVFTRADPSQDLNTAELGHIFLMNINGTDVAQLTDSNGYETFPKVSPDSLWIVFDYLEDDAHFMYKTTRAPPTVSAAIDIDPDTLNLKSNGKFVTAYIELPEGYDMADIDLTTVQLEGISAITDPQYGFVTDSASYLIDHDGDGVLERMVKFDRATLQTCLTNEPDYDSAPKFYDLTLIVTGELSDGTSFEGTDTITVIKK